MRINPGRLLSWDITEQDTSVLFGMGGSGLTENFFGGVRYEQLFARNANALAAIVRVNLSSMLLETSRVAVETLILLKRFCQLFRIGHFFHHNGKFPCCNSGLPQKMN